MLHPTVGFTLTTTTSFPIATYPAGATFGPRRLHDFEFVWMLEGDAVYTRDGISVDAREGAVVLCQPEATDGFEWDRKRRTRHGYFHFLLQGSLPEAWPPITAWPIVRHPNRDDDLLYTLFRHLIAWSEQGDPAQTQLLTQSLLATFVTGHSVANAPPTRDLPDAVTCTLAYISRMLDADPAAKVTLSDMAEVACVSPEYLCRLFSRTIGRSPAESVRLARLERAVILLTRTNFTVTEIAHLTGFDSPFHFSRLIKQRYGLSPRSLRLAAGEGKFTPMTNVLPTI